jgi:glycosyltransferase involved in cell wall biosynthesis
MENTAINKQRILQLCRLTPLWGMDLFREITYALKSEHSEVTTVFLAGKCQSQLDYHGKIHFLALNRKSIFWRIQAFFKLLILCRKEKFDVVICHDYKVTLIMHFVTFFSPVKNCYTMYHTFQTFRKKLQLFFLKQFQKKWYFMTVSSALGKEIQGLNVPLNRIMTVHNTIDIEKLQAHQLTRKAAREKLGLPQEAFIFGTLGRLVIEKAHSVLIDAFRQSWIAREKNCLLVIIGLGPLEDDLKAQVKKHGLENRIFFITDCASEGAHYLNAFDVFVFPSLREAFGIVLLEAACAKLPIIAANSGGIPEAAGPHSCLVPPNDVTSLQRAMEKYFVLSEEKRQMLGEQGFEFIQNNFSLQHYYHAIQTKLNILPVSWRR